MAARRHHPAGLNHGTRSLRVSVAVLSTRTFFQEPGEYRGRFFVGVVHEMGVDIEGSGGVAVAKPAGDGSHVHAGSQQAGGYVMPEVMKAYMGRAGALDQQPEGTGRGVGPPRR